MALLECNIFSESLGMNVSLNVVLPQKAVGQIGLKRNVAIGGETPVLYLLHGCSDDHTIWMRRTSVERYAAQYGLALVMPCVNRSYYADTAWGQKFWTYISEELPIRIQSFFKVSDKRENTFVAGLSMGGYGAMKLAFNHPEKFAAAASFSGPLTNPYELARIMPSRTAEFESIFGKSLSDSIGTLNDLFACAKNCAEKKSVLPKLFISCGTEDFLHDTNLKFADHLRSLNIAFDYSERPGTHEWGFWDEEIQTFLRKLFVRGDKE